MNQIETISGQHWIIALLYTVLALSIVLIYSRRQDRLSVAVDVMEAIGQTDRRTFFSGRYKRKDGARNKVRSIVRQHVLGMFGSIVLSLLRCLAAAIALLLLTVLARWLYGTLLGSANIDHNVMKDSVRLIAAAVDTVTFNLSLALGYDSSLASSSSSLNLIGFIYLLSTALTFATGVFAFLNNLLTTIIALVFPWTLFRAADPGIEIQDNSLWERIVHFLLDFPEIEWVEDILE